MQRNELISYALSFAAFLLRDKNISENTSKIILFGSAARGDFDKESDVDIFVETSLNEKLFQKQLNLFNKSKVGEYHRLSGVRNEIVLKTGQLKKWEGLHESISEDGIILYGKYEEKPEGIERYTMFKISVEKRKFSLKVKIWRRLYGYKQKTNKKTYETKGIIETLGGKKMEKSIIVIPAEKSKEFKGFLNKNNVEFLVNEIWSDDL